MKVNSLLENKQHKTVDSNINIYSFDKDKTLKNYILDIHGNVDFGWEQLKKLPTKFGTIDGNFYVGGNNITSFENFPEVTHGYISCGMNEIETLVGINKHIKQIDDIIELRVNPIVTGGGSWFIINKKFKKG